MAGLATCSNLVKIKKKFLFWCNLIACGISVHLFGPLCVTDLSEIVPNV